MLKVIIASENLKRDAIENHFAAKNPFVDMKCTGRTLQSVVNIVVKLTSTNLTSYFARCFVVLFVFSSQLFDCRFEKGETHGRWAR